MNVLKPHLKATVKTLLDKGVSQWEINQKTGIDRKTIRKYGRLYKLLPWEEDDASKSPTVDGVSTGAGVESDQNPPPRHRLGEKNCPSMLAAYASRIGSGLNSS